MGLLSLVRWVLCRIAVVIWRKEPDHQLYESDQCLKTQANFAQLSISETILFHSTSFYILGIHLFEFYSSSTTGKESEDTSGK